MTGGLFDGEDLKRRGMQLAALGQEEWLRRVRDIAIRIVREKGAVTMDDVQEEAVLPSGASVNLWGSVFKDSCFVRAGYTKSRQPSSHARVIAVWRLGAAPVAPPK